MRCFYFKAIRRGYYLYAYLNSSTLNSFFLNPSSTTFSQTSKSTQQRDFQKLFLLIVFNVDQKEDFVKHRIFEWKCMLRGNTFRCKFFRLVVICWLSIHMGFGSLARLCKVSVYTKTLTKYIDFRDNLYNAIDILLWNQYWF